MTMNPLSILVLYCFLWNCIFGFVTQASCGDLPRALISGWQIEPVRTEPDLVTPVGCCFDDQGRLYVIESHTHFPPDDYAGPQFDRIYRFTDTNGDGKLDEQKLFYEGGVATMGIAFHQGELYVVSRSKLIKLRDQNNDGRADIVTDILILETEANYPHNGLSAVAVGPNGRLYVGLGENFGAPYRLVGRQCEQRGGGEGGNIFCCNPDGSELERFATGLWNPFGLCFDARGDLWTVDNDPDSRPPCRLIRVLEGGDYGFQFRFGRAGTNPLIAWNGELPGTLGMEAGTGEAPCAALPHRGALLVTSWGENRLEIFSNDNPQDPAQITLQVAIQGDTLFRPVGLATAPDGSFLMTDWVDRSYSVHSKGRLWKVTPPGGPSSPQSVPDIAIDAAPPRSPAWIAKENIQTRIVALSRRADLFRMPAPDSPTELMEWLQACRWREWAESTVDHSVARRIRLQSAIASPDSNVRRMAIRFSAETEDRAFLDGLIRNLERTDLEEWEFSETVAAISYLESLSEPDKEASLRIARLAAAIESPNTNDGIKAMAIRFLPANADKPSNSRLSELVRTTSSEDIQKQVILLLTTRRTEDSTKSLLDIAQNSKLGENVRALAIAGLSARRGDIEAAWKELGASVQASPDLHKEWDRVTNALPVTPGLPAPEDLDAWWSAVGSGGDPQAGHRVFLRSVCATCHAYSGRGSSLGPDLSTLKGTSTRKKILESILYPAREIGPLYLPWKILTTDGRSLVGVKLNAGGVGTSLRYLAADGSTFELSLDEIEVQEPSTTSIMPEDAYKSLTLAELQDLLALLE